MKWFILFVGIVFLCFVVALMLGLLGGGMGRPSASLSHERLPEGELHDADLDELVLDVTVRGYRMSQVDGVVDRLRRELRDKDEQIAVLRSGAPVVEPVEPTRLEPPTDLDGPTDLEDSADADEPARLEPPADHDEQGRQSERHDAHQA